MNIPDMSSIPSISQSRAFFNRRVQSPSSSRAPQIQSTSSINKMLGRLRRASSNVCLTSFSDVPTHFDRSISGRIVIKAAFPEFSASTRQRCVFPTPAGYGNFILSQVSKTCNTCRKRKGAVNSHQTIAIPYVPTSLEENWGTARESLLLLA